MLAQHRHRVEMLVEWARHDAQLYVTFKRTLESMGVTLVATRVLDVGCGANAPMTLMLHSSGTAVTGIDGNVGYRWGLGFRPSRYVRYCREAGIARALRKAAGELVYDWRYFRALSGFVGFRIQTHDLDVRRMSVESLGFEDESFDVIHSNATWEHLPDPATALRECARVLRPGGVTYIEIHLFPSLSGGHDLPWIVPGRIELGEVRPWQHLRDPKWTSPVYLNRLRERDYRALFESVRSLDVVEWRTEYMEGQEVLTDDLLAELRHYTAEDLTKRSVVVVARKKTS